MEFGMEIAGRYRVLRCLDEGGMGKIFEVDDRESGEKVALKLLSAELSADSKLAERFMREVEATASVQHENIVRIHDVGMTADQGLFFTMEWLEGRSLLDVMGELLEPMEPARALGLTQQILAGLEAVHRQGVVHRDLSPDNVFVVPGPDDAERIKLVDFGIAWFDDPTRSKLTTMGVTLGTPHFMAPEQLRGDPDLDARIDVHAVGVILFEMLSGGPPFRGANQIAVTYAIMAGNGLTLAAEAPDLAPELAAVVDKSIAHDRNDRWASATEFRDALARFAPA